MTEPLTAVSLHEPQRQSLFAIAFLGLKTIRSIGIVQLAIGVGFVIARSPSFLILIAGVFVVGFVFVAFATLRWWRYTFAVVGGELQVNQGVLSRQTLTVPLDRVQSVSIEQKLLHRFFGLVQVTLDTAGTNAAEFAIDAVSRDVATALQRAAADYRRTAPVSAPAGIPGAVDVDGQVGGPETFSGAPIAPETVLLRHGPERLAKIALAQMPLSGLALLAPLVAFGDDISGWLPVDVPEVDPSFGSWLLWFVPAAIVLVVLVSVVMNVIRVLLADWNLTVTRTDVGLRRDAGLLSTTSVASSVPRVQSVEIVQGVIQRVARLRNVELKNLGDANFSVPGCDEEQAALLRELALDGSQGVPELARRLSPLQVFKATRNTSFVFVPLAVGLWFVIGWWSALFLLAIPPTWALSRRNIRRSRWGIAADSIGLHDETFGWTRKEALLRKTNSVSITQSLFERKRGLATVHVKFAGGILQSGGVSIGMISLDEARAVRDRAIYVAETDRRAFM